MGIYVKNKKEGGMTDISALARLKNKPYGSTLSLLSFADSTNNYIRRLSDILPNGHTVIATEQFSGRGRQGKSFFSPSGNGLYMSILFREPHLVNDGLFTAKISIAVCRAIDRITGTDGNGGVGIKWVNDIYFGSRKLCGILCERLADKDGAPYVIAGIGVNLRTDNSELPKDIRAVACSLFDITRTLYDKYELCALILEELEKVFEEDNKDVLEKYRQRSVVLGHEITVIRSGENIRAAALDICDDGSLLVRYEDGFTAKLCGGEISIRVSGQNSGKA